MVKATIKHLMLFLAMAVLGMACAGGGSLPQGKTDSAVKTRDNFLTKVTPVEKRDRVEVSIQTSRPLKYTVFKLRNPKRLVVDMPGVDATSFTAPIELSAGYVSKVNAKFYPETNSSRLEVYTEEPVLYKVSRVKDNMVVLVVQPHEPDIIRDREVRKGEVEISGIELREANGLARVIISLKDFKGKRPEFKMTRKGEKKRVILDINDAKVQRANEKLLTVTADDSLVENVALFQFSTDPRGVVKVVANLNSFTSSNVFYRDGRIYLDLGSQAIIAEASKVEAEEDKVRDLSEKREKAPEEYTGRRISLDFQGADIQNILRILAEVSGYNIITSENVKGKVSLKLENVPWDLALDTVLKNNNLGMKKNGNILRIATMAEIASEQTAAANAMEANKVAEPLYLKVFEVNYESVEQLRANLETVKSKRGTIDINPRSNTLIIQDTSDKLSEMERLIEILDTQPVQVLIEARIVEVISTYARDLGISWGGDTVRQTGAAFPSTVGLSGIVGGGKLVNVTTTNAGPSSSTATGGLDIRLGHINNVAKLDMQLFAMQSEGKGRILSMPKIATMNNTKANIESGQDVPYSTVSSNGTNIEFKKAVLQLEVTPHVSQDEYIRLEILARKDEPDFANVTASGPPLRTKKAETEVMVKDGDTTVIGGLFKENKTQSQQSVPFFSDIPILGYLFKNKAVLEDGEELLIFITPRVF